MLLQLTLSMFIMYGTQDLYRAYFEPVIAQRAGDIPAGSPERMVLVDVEFHSARVMAIPEVVRKVRELMDPITQEHLGLQAYCKASGHRCLIGKTMNWCLWAEESCSSWMVTKSVLLYHLDMKMLITLKRVVWSLHIIVGSQSKTSCSDTRTLHILGWSNHVVPPLVPMQREDDDAHFLLQQSMTTTPALPDIPLFLRRQQCRILG